jgi:radical SAM protein with 4Fe4S-binding SPASM domain
MSLGGELPAVAVDTILDKAYREACRGVETRELTAELSLGSQDPCLGCENLSYCDGPCESCLSSLEGVNLILKT